MVHCLIFVSSLLDITTQQVLLSGNLNKVLRKTSTETEEKSGRSDFAASYDENNKCISSIGRRLRDEQRSELVSGDSESGEVLLLILILLFFLFNNLMVVEEKIA